MPVTRKIMLIRHAEKPGHSPAAHGIDADGNADPESLTAQGWERARLLVTLFDPKDGGLRAGLARPTALYASKVNGDHGKRPIETLMPLASALHLTIDSSYSGSKLLSQVTPSPSGGLVLALGYGGHQIPDLVKAMKMAGGVALVAWRRSDIPMIAGQIAPSATIPAHWPGKRYDSVWVFDLNDDGATYRFSQVPEALLPGDLEAPI